MNMTPILTISRLKKRFGKKIVLDDLNLELEQGQVYGLLGKNGAGKTTLIRIIMGAIPADSGEVGFLGKKVTPEQTGYKRKIGFIAEDCIFYSWMSVQDLLAFNAAFYPRWDWRKTDIYLDRFELDRKIKIKYLSRGMKLKLGFVAALAGQPDLLILDDPTSGMDVPTRHEFLQNIIQEILEAGTTILFSSHLVHELEGIIERIGILDRGRLVLDAAYQEVKDNVRKVSFTADPASIEALHIEGILQRHQNGNRHAITVYPWKEETERRLKAAAAPDLELHPLSLEEIFISFIS